ncbi:YceI family protein [Marinobacterium sedimentorum]|uniref:YceI family protein n=1 Tax=Marinobacterium sedimentorum TaxID=2927804 RepID=UPI0020C68D1C|nr:YceI family protein [Marinobacterium sedimentorum]MCP8686460.1 YceI family protein [Marinobacterium sedimentorum]
MKTNLIKCLALGGLLAAGPLYAAEYAIDTEGAHASVNFRANHLGFSWVTGRLEKFDGSFNYDAADPNSASVAITIEAASVNTNQAERDKHLRSAEFLDAATYPEITFISTSYKTNGDGTGVLKGDLSLHGITKPVTINVTRVGEGDDPWGGYRAGFKGTAELKLKEFGINYNLGPAAETIYLDLNIEGVRK